MFPLAAFRIVMINLVGTFNVLAPSDRQDRTDWEERGVIINTASVAA